jgi:hypothetical protein
VCLGGRYSSHGAIVTDDEIRHYLKPKPVPWLAIGAFTISVLGAGAAVARFAFTAPTRDDYELLRSDVTTVRQDHAVLKAGVDGLRSDMGDVKIGFKELNSQLLQLRVTGSRRHGE